MNTLEDQLWDYIDGTSSEQDRRSLEQLLEQDMGIRKLYGELLEIHGQLKMTELEEPSLRFTQNVIERVALEPEPKITTTKVDQRIISGIGTFFLITIMGLLVYTLAQLNWGSTPSSSSLGFTMPDINWSTFFNHNLTAFLIVDEVVGLFLLDKWMSRSKVA